MKFFPTKINGVVLIELERRVDDRGFFARQWCAQEFAGAGLDIRIAQINTARSTAAGTLRGMHYQKSPHGEAKLVRCTSGVVYDVAVDLRPQSPTYRQWFGIELDSATGRMLYIPEGCAHGYLTLTADADLSYQATVPYAPASASGVRHDDPAFGIVWPAPIRVMSEQDRSWPYLERTDGGVVR